MILIFGGAYQGKLDWAKKEYHIKDEEIFFCTSGTEEKEEVPELDLDASVIYSLENFTLACVRKSMEAKDYMRENRDRLENKIIICTDISQGVVPRQKEQRDWREMTGRVMNYLAAEADEVIRIFCGLPHKLK